VKKDERRLSAAGTVIMNVNAVDRYITFGIVHHRPPKLSCWKYNKPFISPTGEVVIDTEKANTMAVDSLKSTFSENI